MTTRITFSPFTAEPRYIQAVTEVVLQAQIQLAIAAWEAQLQFVQAIATASLAANWSMVTSLRQAHSPQG